MGFFSVAAGLASKFIRSRSKRKSRRRAAQAKQQRIERQRERERVKEKQRDAERRERYLLAKREKDDKFQKTLIPGILGIGFVAMIGLLINKK